MTETGETTGQEELQAEKEKDNNDVVEHQQDDSEMNRESDTSNADE